MKININITKIQNHYLKKMKKKLKILINYIKKLFKNMLLFKMCTKKKKQISLNFEKISGCTHLIK